MNQAHERFRDYDWESGSGTDPSAEDEVMNAEEANGFQHVVDSMPTDLRDIYVLWSTGAYSERELAEEFGVSRGFIHARIKRIRTYLRERVDTDTAMATGLLHPTAMVESASEASSP